MAEQNKNVNVASKLFNMNITDAEVCEDLGLDISLIGTPQLNIAAIDSVYKRNLSDMIESGMSEKEAMKIAKANRSDALKLVRSIPS